MSTTTEHPSCEDRIDQALESRLEDLADMVEGFQSPDQETSEEAREQASSYGLALTFHRVVTWQLSTGGPGDELRFTLDEDDQITRIEYAFKDWFDGATRDLTGRQFDMAEEFFDYELRGFVECR